MRLVLFTSAIAFGFVGGLSQAGDWHEPLIGAQFVRFDLGERGQDNALAGVAAADRPEKSRQTFKTGPNLGRTGWTTTRQRAGDSPQLGFSGRGLSVLLNRSLSVSAEISGHDQHQTRNFATDNHADRFIVRAAFRF